LVPRCLLDLSAMSEKATPVTVVTGFLGAGKTTLVNYILNKQTSRRICVIENEYGEIAIDNALVGENLKSDEDIITMDNGCVCCTVRGDLVKALLNLATRRTDFDAILIETTGIADPSPIIAVFNSNEFIALNYTIDSVLCLVDAKHIIQHLDEVKPDDAINEAQQQVAFADKVIINKTDLVNAKQLRGVKRRLRRVNKFAQLLQSQQSQVNIDEILGLGAFNIDNALSIDPKLLEAEDDVCDDSDCDLDHDHSKHDHDHHHHHKHDHKKDPDHKEHDHDHGKDGHKEHDHHKDHDHKEHDHGQGKEHKNKDENQAVSGNKRKEPDEAEGHGNTKSKRKKHDLNEVKSCGLRFSSPFDMNCFNATMEYLLGTRSKDIFRSKGVLAFHGNGRDRFVFQGVHENAQLGKAKVPFEEKDPLESCLVFIGKGLDRAELQSMFDDCVHPVKAEVAAKIADKLEGLLSGGRSEEQQDLLDEAIDLELMKLYAQTQQSGQSIRELVTELKEKNELSQIISDMSVDEIVEDIEGMLEDGDA